MKKENNLLSEILKSAEEERYNLKHPYVGSEHLFLTILKRSPNLKKYLKEYGVTYSSFKKELINVVGSCTKESSDNLYTPLLRKILKRSETVNSNIDDIYENLFISLLDEGEGIAIRILLRMDVDLDEIYLTLKEKQKLNKMEESNKIGILLNDNINLNENIVCRGKELEKIILTLTRKKKCNPLLIGPAGVGKTALVEELTRRIISRNVPESLYDYKIYMIEMGSLISGTKYRGEFEERLNKIIKEIINSKKTIIFIDEIHSMVGAGGAEGAINAADILKPYLARGDIKCIGATTPNEYKNSILKDKALARRFDVINVSEPSKDCMYKLLLSIKSEYEEYHKIKIPNKVLNNIIDLSDYYMKTIVNPDKSIDLLDSSCAYAKINKESILTYDDVINTVFNKTNNYLIKTKEFTNNLSNNLLNYIPKNVIKEIINTFKLKNNLPKSFLINNEKLINIIKNELGEINIINIDINTLNGPLYKDKLINETILNPIMEAPYSLVHISNIDSANKEVIDEIITINKEGVILLKNNEKLFFNNAVIIGSTNDKEVYETGFNKTLKTRKISSDLVNSFNCDLRNISFKEYVSL